jgi:S-adenosylmethionine:tRNA ribosyltransferase-isomerase
MRRDEFFYELPLDLIAHYPKPERSASRLLALDGASGELQHLDFKDCLGLIEADDLVVFNDTKVIPARLYGHKETGGKVEILIERVLDSRRALSQIKASKPPKPGSKLFVGNGDAIVVEGREGDFFKLRFESAAVDEVLNQHGHMPLPPYIERSDEDLDRERYQTLYAKNPGAVAAPTAGLHFDESLLNALENKGVDIAYVTLHVGAGTYQPVRVDVIEEHRMHSEYIEVSEEVCRKVEAARARGGRVIAVGTTCVRSLETAANAAREEGRSIVPYFGDTSIFIYPGYRFLCVDGMITNFHLPESTLLMLVCAFAGYDHVFNAYRSAIENRYRFFSYGDAMFLSRSLQSSDSEQESHRLKKPESNS